MSNVLLGGSRRGVEDFLSLAFLTLNFMNIVYGYTHSMFLSNSQPSPKLGVYLVFHNHGNPPHLISSRMGEPGFVKKIPHKHGLQLKILKYIYVYIYK